MQECLADVNSNGYIDADDLLQRGDGPTGSPVTKMSTWMTSSGWDFIPTAEAPRGDNEPADINGHGTHVAGIMAASSSTTSSASAASASH